MHKKYQIEKAFSMRTPLSIYHIWILLACALSSTEVASLLQNQPNASDVERNYT